MDTAKFVMSDIGPEKLDISALRALLAIAEHGGVTRAADHLALSPSAVSHKIRRLEETLHCSLLTRRLRTGLCRLACLTGLLQQVREPEVEVRLHRRRHLGNRTFDQRFARLEITGSHRPPDALTH